VGLSTQSAPAPVDSPTRDRCERQPATPRTSAGRGTRTSTDSESRSVVSNTTRRLAAGSIPDRSRIVPWSALHAGSPLFCLDLLHHFSLPGRAQPPASSSGRSHHAADAARQIVRNLKHPTERDPFRRFKYTLEAWAIVSRQNRDNDRILSRKRSALHLRALAVSLK
jgi:hypothetical protein